MENGKESKTSKGSLHGRTAMEGTGKKTTHTLTFHRRTVVSYLAPPISHPQTNLLLGSCVLTNLVSHLSSCNEVRLNMHLDWLRLDIAGEVISGVIPTHPPSVPGAREAHETSKNPTIIELKTMLLYIQRAVVSY